MTNFYTFEYLGSRNVSNGSFSDSEQRSHEVRFALWTGPRRRPTHRRWRNDIPFPVAQFVAHKLLQASSRKRRNPKRYRLFKHQVEVEVAPLGSATAFLCGCVPFPFRQFPHPDLRSHVTNLLKDGPITRGLTKLACAVAESPDEDGLLLLVRIEKELKRAVVTQRAIEQVVTEHVPASDWAGAYNVMPVPAGSLRQKLLALTTDGGPADIAARWLRQIDWIRDEHGMPETEPRHPDLASGKPWPIMQPDPDADAEG
jgi:hypothetical protein